MEGKALGKGLSALIPEKIKSENGVNVIAIKIDEISNNSQQPRTNYDNEKLDDLKASIKEKGILQPIIVREKNNRYEVVAGERRLRAARALQLQEVPVIVKNVTDQEALVIALIENIQREELNPMEEAEAYKKLVENFQFTQDAVAQAVGKDRSTVANLLRLLKLPENIKQSVYTEEISAGHARALLGVADSRKMESLYQKTIKKRLSVRELESTIRAFSKTEDQKGKIRKAENPQIGEVEDGLQKLLGTKVKIVTGKKRGKIVIDYYSYEDLNRIVKEMIK